MTNFKHFHLFMILLEGGLLYLASNLGIGSVEDKQKIINEELAQFITARLVFNAVIFLIPLLVIYFINKRFLKRGIEKRFVNLSYLIHLLSFLILTGLFVGFSILKYV